jgi:hypothetical protein
MVHPLSETYGVNRQKYKTGQYAVKFTRLVGLWPRKVYLQWTLSGITHATGYTFTVESSASPEGPWELLTTTPLTDTFYYMDDSFSAPADRTHPGLMDLRNIHYYKVTATHADEGVVTVIEQLSGSAADQRREGIIRKLRRDANVALRKGNGTEVAILKRRWWGTACTCKSATGQVTRSHCATCNGTGIVTGYWSPVYTFGSRTEAGPDEQVASAGTVETRYLQVMLPYIPEVQPKDILVFLRDNRRFIVDSKMNTSIQTQVVHQELRVSEIATTSVEYSIPVDPWVNQGWF